METRSGRLEPGGSLSLYGGARGTLQPAASWAGTTAGWDVFATGSLLRTDQGIENPDRSRTAVNGQSRQLRGLVTAATAAGRHHPAVGHRRHRAQPLPRPGHVRGWCREFTAFGDSGFASADLRARQWERNWYGVAALQKSYGDVDLQLAGFGRSGSIHYVPS